MVRRRVLLAGVVPVPVKETIYSGQELRDRLEQVGFVDVKLYGNLAGDEYGPNALRLVAVGRKPR